MKANKFLRTQSESLQPSGNRAGSSRCRLRQPFFETSEHAIDVFDLRSRNAEDIIEPSDFLGRNTKYFRCPLSLFAKFAHALDEFNDLLDGERSDKRLRDFAKVFPHGPQRTCKPLQDFADLRKMAASHL